MSGSTTNESTVSGPEPLLRASAVMAIGTTFSRISGLLRAVLLAAAIGNLLAADVFNIANTVPNMLYILLAGGVFNAVLVPQLVRSMKADADGGAAYANRVVTAATLFLGLVTVAMVIGAPWLMRLFLNPAYFEPEMAAQLDSVVDFARYCLPQVFFYGMFVLAGQILNARGKFGPMMWAPIANNAIAVLVLIAYLLSYGPARGADLCGGFSPGQELLLGLGSTAGIVVQFAILIPYLRAAGFRFSPRFDFRSATAQETSLRTTFRLGVWTLSFVIVNQIAYTVVVKLASGGTAVSCESDPGTGYTVYAYAFLLAMVPHSIVTVSLATAVLPRLADHASDGDRPDALRELARTLAQTIRTALSVIVPFACLLPVIAPMLARVTFGWSAAAAATVDLYVPSLILFGISLVFFTVHYLVLRGFYALELNRTVFFIQCAVALTNIILAITLVSRANREQTAPALVVAYGTSYVVGACVSYLVLRRRLGGLETGRLAAFLARILPAALVASIAAFSVHRGLAALVADPTTHAGEQLWASATLLIVVAVAAGTFFMMARILRMPEVTDLLRATMRRSSSMPGRNRREGIRKG
ncbi:MAG: murein biosynthesis integral membrane protein MurJ [Nocardioides sp.]